MQNLMTFKGNKVETICVQEVIYFNPYHVGRCLELTESAVRKAVAKMTKSQVVKLTNSIVKEIPNCVIPPSGKLFLTESGVYKLAFRSNKQEAEEFTNWVTSEVLPSIRKTGSYNMAQKTSAATYEYFDKFWNDQPVMIITDFEYFTKISKSIAEWHLRKPAFKEKEDYELLAGENLLKFKAENPRVSRLFRWLLVLTKSGFNKLSKMCGVKVKTPECFKQLPPSESKGLKSPVDVGKRLKAIRERLNAVSYLLTDFELFEEQVYGEYLLKASWVATFRLAKEIDLLAEAMPSYR